MEKKCFSFVIRPNDTVISRVQEMRDQMGDSGKKTENISPAHIPILEFEAFDQELELLNDYVVSFMEQFTPQDISFAGFDALQPSPGRDNGILFFNPDKKSAAYIQQIATSFYENFPMKDRTWVYLSQKPSMSLASGLSKNRLMAARQFFIGMKLASLSFPCQGLSLREFDPEIRDFKYVKTYSFEKVI